METLTNGFFKDDSLKPIQNNLILEEISESDSDTIKEIGQSSPERQISLPINQSDGLDSLNSNDISNASNLNNMLLSQRDNQEETGQLINKDPEILSRQKTLTNKVTPVLLTQKQPSQHSAITYLQQADDIMKRKSLQQSMYFDNRLMSNTKKKKSNTISDQFLGNQELMDIKQQINQGIFSPIRLKDMDQLSTPSSSFSMTAQQFQQLSVPQSRHGEQIQEFAFNQNESSINNQDNNEQLEEDSKIRLNQSEQIKLSPPQKGFFKNMLNEIKGFNKKQEVQPKSNNKQGLDEVRKTMEIKRKQSVYIKSDFMTSDFKNLKSSDTLRQNEKKFMLYPEDPTKSKWDLFITILLLFTCIATPARLAFSNYNQQTWEIIDMAVDFCFFLDIIINFFSAYYDSEFILVHDLKTIAKSYISSWFFIDLISIIPFDKFFSSGSYNRLARFARIGKLYKLVKMTRLVRMLKIVKERNKLVKYLNEILKIGIGFERLLFFILIFLTLCHIAACLWIVQADFDERNKNTWIFQCGFTDMSNYELYITSYYFTVTTIVTVGFGDIHAYNTQERIISIFLMIIGVIAFSFATGSLSSILQNYDASQAQLKEKIATLNDIRRDYSLGHELYDELRVAIKYDHNKNYNDVKKFMEELPYKLRIELAMEIHKDIYMNIEFFHNKDKSFIAWVGPLLKPILASEFEYIFKEGDDIKEIYFMVAGIAGYVLPRFSSAVYIEVEKGDHFGLIDLVFDTTIFKDKIKITRETKKNDNLVRRFTVQALTNCDLLTLSLEELDQMKLEFPDIFEELFKNTFRRLKKALKTKLEAIQLYERLTKSSNLSSFRVSQTLSSIKNLSYADRHNKLIRKYKKNKKNRNPLTKSEVHKINNFSSNATSLRKIDEEEIEDSCSDSNNRKENKEFDEDQHLSVESNNKSIQGLQKEKKKSNKELQQNEEEKLLVGKFSQQFSNFFKKNYQIEEETKLGVEEMREKILKLEEQFTYMMSMVEKINKSLETIQLSQNQ